MAKKTSGTTAIATTSASNATLIAADATITINRVTVINEGTVAGFFSSDNGTNWVRIPAAAAATSPVSVTDDFRENPRKLAYGVLIKRDGGSNMAAVWGYVD